MSIPSDSAENSSSGIADAMQPSEFRRVLWISAALMLATLPFSPYDLFSMLWWGSLSLAQLSRLVLPVTIGFTLGLICGLCMCKRYERIEPLWKVYLAGTGGAAIVSGLIYLRETGIWIWSFDAGDAMFSSTILALTLMVLFTSNPRGQRFAVTAIELTG